MHKFVNINRGKLTEINRFLTEQTPKIYRLTDRSNFSRIPNPSGERSFRSESFRNIKLEVDSPENWLLFGAFSILHSLQSCL